MPKFLIERALPGAGQFTAADLQSISQKSCGVLGSMGTGIQWMHSYVTADAIHCVYLATDEAAVRRHGEIGGFPVTRVMRVHEVIDPATAE